MTMRIATTSSIFTFSSSSCYGMSISAIASTLIASTKKATSTELSFEVTQRPTIAISVWTTTISSHGLFSTTKVVVPKPTSATMTFALVDSLKVH